jgi:hypothetical protein
MASERGAMATMMLQQHTAHHLIDTRNFPQRDILMSLLDNKLVLGGMMSINPEVVDQEGIIELVDRNDRLSHKEGEGVVMQIL